MNIIEFLRCVHAEMSSIVDAARRGIAVEGATLYCTTFPCHECAKHIVAAGIRRVVYIEPYAKSLVSELYPDSIEVEESTSNGDRVLFQPFVGVAPTRYLDLFLMVERKAKGTHGKRASWDHLNAMPRLPQNSFAALARISHEDLESSKFLQLLKEKQLLPVVEDQSAASELPLVN